VTESEWLASKDPTAMLEFLRNSEKASDRKLRLFAVACCRSIWPWFEDEASKKAVDASERFADGLIDPKQLEHAHDTALFAECNEAAMSTSATKITNVEASDAAAWGEVMAGHDECTTQAALLRDIFGNPFRPWAVDSAWRTPEILSLAERAYENRNFSQMPALADALEEAGCRDAAILDHLRGPGPHVRGCGVVDLVLNKK
jgi:hypothetical protein